VTHSSVSPYNCLGRRTRLPQHGRAGHIIFLFSSAGFGSGRFISSSLRNISLRASCLIFIGIWISLFSREAYSSQEYCSSVKYNAKSDRARDIEFVFDKAYLCGKFANGDWWVAAGESKAVTIIDVLPKSGTGFNGLEINPSSKLKQGFDERIYGYDSAMNAELPLHVSGDASIVKAVSVATEKNKCRPCLQFAAVLTVLRAPVAESDSALRPAYFGSDKTVHQVDKNIAGRLPKYRVDCCSEAKYRDFEVIAERYRRVQLDHLENWMGGNMHPAENMPDYGASIAVDSAVSVLRFLLSDFDLQRQSHRLALVRYLQMGVDLQAMALAGVKWPGNGGHGNGRKLPILFAATLLDQDQFNNVLAKTVFSEDAQIYFSEKAGKALYGVRCTDNEYWMTTRLDKGARDCRDPYGYIDGGGHEIGEAYQLCCTSMPWKYTALAVRMLGWEKFWRNDAFLEYADRWVNEGTWASPDPCAPYNNLPGDYLQAYGAGKGQDCIPGEGRYKNKHGTNRDAGHYRSPLGDQLWRTYRRQLSAR
jgi:hypothetical protein